MEKGLFQAAERVGMQSAAYNFPLTSKNAHTAGISYFCDRTVKVQKPYYDITLFISDKLAFYMHTFHFICSSTLVKVLWDIGRMILTSVTNTPLYFSTI